MGFYTSEFEVNEVINSYFYKKSKKRNIVNMKKQESVKEQIKMEKLSSWVGDVEDMVKI